MARGGKREGAGRKAGGRNVVRKWTAEEILASVDEQECWRDILTLPARLAKREDVNASTLAKAHAVKLDALKYLTDRRDGKAAQPVTGEHGNGPVEIRVLIETVGSRNGHGSD